MSGCKMDSLLHLQMKFHYLVVVNLSDWRIMIYTIQFLLTIVRCLMMLSLQIGCKSLQNKTPEI